MNPTAWVFAIVRLCNRLKTTRRRGFMLDFRNTAGALALAVCLVSTGAYAQSTDAGSGQPGTEAKQADDSADDESGVEIVVTAQKSGAQTLQRVPLAIQAFTGA